MSPRNDPLADYRRKRDFSRTPEPSGGVCASAGALQFVIQKHWASHLHYDLRLELGGTMKSWAVPKGPSYDSADKRMAVQVEDHPMAYNRFEGRIPAGQYGAGEVILWDCGWWLPEGDPGQGYRDGKLKFELQGHKLQGHWTLVRMRAKPGQRQAAWLLIKERDRWERPGFDVVLEMPDSVSAQVHSRQPTALPRVQPAVKAGRLPLQLAPQLATLAGSPPTDPENWIFESKFDGYRLLARVQAGRASLYTRNGKDWTARLPTLARALAALPMRSGWIDGEIIQLDDKGRPDFQALQNAFDGESTQHLVFFAFDLLFLDGQDWRALPVEQRRDRLQSLLAHAGDGPLRFSQDFEAPPAELVAAACRLGLEGVIGKRRGSAYVSRRSADWIKLKCQHSQEFVIVGYTDPQGSRVGLGALLLAVHGDDGQLQGVGRVGTGFSARSLAALRPRLDALATRSRPLADDAGAGNVHWVRPVLLAQVSFAGWTGDGKLRQAVFHGLREDKPARQIVREEPAMSPPASHGVMPEPLPVAVSHPGRVIDPASGTTKLELVRYYAKVAPLMVAHLKGRPVALVRAPQGIEGSLFFQKHMASAGIDGMTALPPALDPGHPPLMEVARGSDLAAAAQMNTLEFHTWNARKDRIDRPDRLSFDLDPGEGVPWEQVQEAARLLHVLLQELQLPAFLKTSGGKGLHLIVPIKRLHGWDAAKGFARALVRHLANTIPQRFVDKSGPRNRIGKVFVDYLRNGFGATTACAWTVRARPGLGVSVPVAWDELDSLTGSAHWSLRNVHQRMPVGNTPWDGYEKSAVSLTGAMKALGYRYEPAP